MPRGTNWPITSGTDPESRQREAERLDAFIAT